ncbi:N-acetylmuramoyl-L-alanine amidase [Natranaerovirga hydrolytica]|uniref:N-acetylmuramoyl-L-alanine amidase n=1 Tax=Natranaerovirga hydrolytica TaxID=680378 RepID=A0A4R1M6N3_9FIRM|nr:N-acetylmuramoyl-L-alanine amidase CwlD [Natranaerovirga hydrolytica]TCK87916.1 N-acetylmuramoyl-L-alanine amidase [Natranaerovirga hydrolytica]
MKRIITVNGIKYILVVILLLLVFNLCVTYIVRAKSSFFNVKTVIVDPGHGGRDPGKVAVNGAFEKDINLEIALKLKTFLEQGDIKVIMTRETDIGLYSESDSNKKRADLNKRAQIIQENNADLVVSIHQNSFHQEKYNGAQVFYYSSSQEGEALAEAIQNEIIRYAQPKTSRTPKANDAYFILKQTPCPAVIVECGFLSNWEEADRLQTKEYQEKLAWSIFMGIKNYFNENE